MNLNIEYAASASGAPSWFQGAVSYVASFFDALVANPITVNVEVGWGEVNGQALPANAAGENEASANTLDYQTLKTALTANATSANDRASIAALPSTDPTNGGQFYVPVAMEKALGLVDPNATAIDGYVGLNSTLPWSSTPNGPVASGTYDAIGALEHEVSEVLGRVGYLNMPAYPGVYGPMDLFRYSAPGQHALTQGPGSFSVDGQTMLQQFNDPTHGGDAADWTPTLRGDTFGNSASGVASVMSSADYAAMDVLGYTLAPSLSIDPTVSFLNANAVQLSGKVSDPGATVRIWDGTATLGTATVNADGTWTFTGDVSGCGGRIGATEITSTGQTTSSVAAFSIQAGIAGQPYATVETEYDATGGIAGQIFLNADGSVYLSDTVTTTANGDQSYLYSAGSALTRRHVTSRTDLYAPDGSLLEDTATMASGRHFINGSANGLVIDSLHNDVMTGGGGNETFVFKPMPGHETVTDFLAAGRQHDILSLSTSDFSTIADVLKATKTVGNDAVITLTPQDAITLQNVTAETLKAHPSDLRLHA